MVDFPWYMGMAPLLGWCLDAIITSRRFDSSLPSAVERSASRMEFVLRQAFPGHPARGGWMLALWIGSAAWLLGWVLTSGAWVVAGHYVSFAAWTAIFFFAFTMRGQATAALRMQRALEEDQTKTALAWLQFMGGASEGEDAEVLAGAGVQQLARAVVRSAVLPLFWGLVLGAGGALAALCLQELARQIDGDKTDDPFWQPVRRIADWIAQPPCWLAVVFIQATIPFSGGRRGAAMAGFLNRFREEPLDRVAAAVAYGLDLGPSAAGHADGAKVSPPDLQRAAVLLWTSTGLAAASVALIGSLLYRFLL